MVAEINATGLVKPELKFEHLSRTELLDGADKREPKRCTSPSQVNDHDDARRNQRPKS